MTLIVASPKEGLLMTDGLQVIEDNLHKSVHSNDVELHQQKIKITEGGYIAYVFDFKVDEVFAKLACNFIYRLEDGTLGVDETLGETGKENFYAFFMTKRRFYFLSTEDGKYKVDVKHNLHNNVFGYTNRLASTLNITCDEYFSILKKLTPSTDGSRFVSHQKDLNLIPKKRGKKK